jgi:hypothetical protein
MNYKYHVILGSQLIILRWPSDVAYDDTFVEALIAQMDKQKRQFYMDASVVGDLVITDAPISNVKASGMILRDAFAGDPDSLPEFILWDYRDGKFVTINRRERKRYHRSADRPLT